MNLLVAQMLDSFLKEDPTKTAKITLKGHLRSEPNANLDAFWITCSDFMHFNTNVILHLFTIWKKQILVGEPIRNTSTTAQWQYHCMKLPENNTFSEWNWMESKHEFLKMKVTPVFSSCFHQENRIKLNLLLYTITDLCDYMGQDMPQTCKGILV